MHSVLIVCNSAIILQKLNKKTANKPFANKCLNIPLRTILLKIQTCTVSKIYSIAPLPLRLHNQCVQDSITDYSGGQLGPVRQYPVSTGI